MCDYKISMSYNSLRNNIFWNTAGNIIYLICQWLLSVVVVRISGSYADAGVLTLVTSINKRKKINDENSYSCRRFGHAHQ